MNDQDFTSTEMDENQETQSGDESNLKNQLENEELNESKKAKLTVKKDDSVILEYVIEKLPVTIGRKSENDIVLEERNISRKHAQIDIKEENYILCDLESSLGTKVNGELINETDIHTGDIIEIGKYQLLFNSGIPEDERTILDTEEETVLEEGTALDEDRTKFYEEPEAKLVVVQSDVLEGEIILEDEEVLIGRDESVTLPIDDQKVSRQHCKIIYKDGCYRISDLGSANGTFVNNQKIDLDHLLQSGDKLQMGSTILEFRIIQPKTPIQKRSPVRLFKIIGAILILLIISYTIYQIVKSPKEHKVIMQILWEEPMDGSIEISPSIGDINGDGFQNIVFSDNKGIVASLDGRQGGLTWNQPFSRTGGAVSTSITLADINRKDGELDVVVGTKSNGILTIDGSTGRQIWRTLLNASPSMALAAADINDDGTHDIFIGTEDGNVFCLDGRQGGTVWSYDTRGGILSAPVLSDVNSDQVPDVIIGNLNNRLFVLDGKNGAHLWSYVDTEPPSTAASANFNEDKIPDIAVAYGSKVLMLDGKRGFVIWKWIIPESALPTIDDLFIPLPPAVSDLNNDKIPDVIVSTPGGHVYAIDGGSEGNRYIWDFSLSSVRKTSPSLCDFNGDGTADVVVGDTEGILTIINGKTGHRLNQMKLHGAIVSSPVIGDVSADGQVNIITGTLNNKIITIQTETTIEKNLVIWNSFGGNSYNQSYLP